MTDVYYDTEFHDTETVIDLISIGMVCGDRELYAVNANMDQHAVRNQPWLRRNVWSQLPTITPKPGYRGGHEPRLDTEHPDVRPKRQIARMVSAFLAEVDDPQLWAYYSAYDHVVLSQLFGRMIDLPEHIPMQTDCLKQEAKRLGNPVLPVQMTPEHHALNDAYHDRHIHDFLRKLAA